MTVAKHWLTLAYESVCFTNAILDRIPARGAAAAAVAVLNNAIFGNSLCVGATVVHAQAGNGYHCGGLFGIPLILLPGSRAATKGHLIIKLGQKNILRTLSK